MRAGSLGGAVDLAELPRGILALMQMGVLNSVRMSRCLVKQDREGTEEEAELRVQKLAKRIRYIRDRLRNSKHPVILHVLAKGIPASAGVELNPGEEVKCRECGYRLCFVPCVKCTKVEHSDVLHKHRKSGVKPPSDEPPLQDGATNAYPGTWEKIEVMRRRVEAGKHLHHPGDRQLDTAA